MIKRQITLSILIFFLVLGICGAYYFNKPHSGISNERPAFVITALDLYNEFNQNEISANKKYLNKVLSVKGIVSNIQTLNGQDLIQLNSGDNAGGISCLESKSEVNNSSMLKPGQMVSIKGKCSGFLMDVNLVDCIVEK